MTTFDVILTRTAETAITTAHYLEEQAQKSRDRAWSALDDTPSRIAELVSLIKKTVYIIFVLSVLFVSSIFLYGMIYWVAIPPEYISKPLYFDYNYRDRSLQYQCQHNDLNPPDSPHFFQNEETRQESSNLDNSSMQDMYIDQVANYTEANRPQRKFNNNEELSYAKHGQNSLAALHPRAKMHLFASHTQWHAHTPEVAPPFRMNGEHVSLLVPSSSQPRFLSPKRFHFIDVSLLLAESEINRQLGMFMVEVDLLDADMSLLASSARSSMIPYESPLVSFARKLLLIFPFVLGTIPEARKVTLNCFDHFVESDDRPLAWIEVRLIVPQLSAFSPVLGSIQILSADIRIGKELNLIQQFMKNWFCICAIMSIFLLLIGQTIFFLIFHAWYVEYKAMRTPWISQVQQEGRFDIDHLSCRKRKNEKRELALTKTPPQDVKDGASGASREETYIVQEEMGHTDTEFDDDGDKDDR